MTDLRRNLTVGLCLATVQVLAIPSAPTRRDLRLTDVVPVGRSQAPGSFQWSPDGTRLGFMQRDKSGHSLWILDPVLGNKIRLVSAADLALTDDGPESIDAYHWSPSGNAVLLEADGDLFLIDSVRNAEPRRLTATAAEETDPAFSPRGDAIAFVRDHDLHLLDIESGLDSALTSGGVEDETLNGETDWVYWEEIWGRDSTGHWWSPDGRRIAYYQFDETPVRSYALLNAMPHYPEVLWQKYPKAGENNPVVRIGVVRVPGGETVWMDTGKSESYLARVEWTPDGKQVAIQRLNREQDRLHLLLCDADSGRCRTILTESWPTWVNLGDDFAFLEDGRFIWGSERLGWRHLYLYGADGRRSAG